jgi:hypothetical protein
MADDVKHGREFGPIEQQALAHVWIHSARWLDLAERDGLFAERVVGCSTRMAARISMVSPGPMSSMSVMAVPKSPRRWRNKQESWLMSLPPVTRTSQRCSSPMYSRALPGRPRPVLLLLRRFGSDRKRAEDRQAGAGDARVPQTVQNHRSARRLPRRDICCNEHYLVAQ